MNWSLLLHSLALAAGTTALSVGLGLLVALRLASLSQGGRRLLWLGALATLALPPLLLVNCWIDLFGASGLLRPWWPLPLYSIPGASLVLSSGLWPISTLLVLGAWDRVEPAMLEVDPRLRGFAMLRWVLGPAAAGAVRLAAALTFTLSLNQFTVPVILQVPVFAEELWLALTTRLDNAGAWSAALPMLLVPCLAVLSCGRQPIAWPRWSDSRDRAAAIARRLGPAGRRLSSLATIAALGVGAVLPLVQLLAQARTWKALPDLLKSSSDAIGNSVLLAAATSLAVVSMGLALRGRRWGGWLWVGFFLPGILLSQLPGRGLAGTILASTMAPVLVAFAVRYLALGWSALHDAERTIDPDLLAVGRLETSRAGPRFRFYAWPQLRRPAAIAGYIVYLLALWEVETLVLIHPPGGDTLALRIFQMLHYGHNAQVNAMCVVLLALAVMPLLVAWVVRLLLGPAPTPPRPSAPS